MTDFQVALLVMGGCAVAAVLVYNKVQERRARRQGKVDFPEHASDPLFERDDGRREPAGAPESPSTEHRVERRSGADFAVPDRRIDYVIDVKVDTLIAEAACLDLWRAIQRRFRERTAIAGSIDGIEWSAIDGSSQSSWLEYRAGLQLVSRSGAAAEADILEFRTMIDGLAAQLGGIVKPGDARHAIAYAHELDEFCAESDIQIALHLVAPEGAPFRSGEVIKVAEHNGLLGSAGSFQKPNASGDYIFDLRFEGDASYSRGTFTLDVPTVVEPEEAYKQMILVAQAFQRALGGVLVDDNGGALSDDGFAATWRTVNTVIRGLVEKGFRPGLPITKRLFS